MSDAPLVQQALNRYWCARHWQPYLDLPEAAGTYANRAVPEALWSRKDFREDVRAKRLQWGPIKNAPLLVVKDWTERLNMPMCCILGDAVMDAVLEKARIHG